MAGAFRLAKADLTPAADRQTLEHIVN